MDKVKIIATTLQLAGAAATMFGAWQTWHEFATPGQRFWEPFLRPFVRAWRWLTRLVRRIFRRGRKHVVGLGGVSAGGATVRARGRVGFRPLPSLDEPAAFVAEVKDQIDRVHNLAQDIQERLADESEARRHANDQLRGDLDTRIAKVESMTRNVAVGGLRLEALGVALVVAGTVVGFFAD